MKFAYTVLAFNYDFNKFSSTFYSTGKQRLAIKSNNVRVENG